MIFHRLSKHFRIVIDPHMNSLGFCCWRSGTVQIKRSNDWMTLFHECAHATLPRIPRPYLGPDIEECIAEFTALGVCIKLGLTVDRNQMSTYVYNATGTHWQPREWFETPMGKVVFNEAEKALIYLLKILIDKP